MYEAANYELRVYLQYYIEITGMFFLISEIYNGIIIF